MGDLRQIHPPVDLELPELGDTLRELALEVEEAELRIKEAILEAAKQGDTPAIAALVRRWLEEPPVEIAESLEARR